MTLELNARTSEPEAVAALQPYSWSIPFPMQAEPAAELAMFNPDVEYEADPSSLVSRFAWTCPPVGQPLRSPARTFFADCYGGAGSQYNGGGVRCALDGAWQVKGTGINLLSGYTAHELKWAFGTCSVGESFEEAMWGEIFHHALPYGAARVPAVIATGTATTTQQKFADRANTRGLIVRQFAFRPAHFMRAVYFVPDAEFKRRHGSDASRVIEAVRQLPGLLPQAHGDSKHADGGVVELLHTGLFEMARRFAEQAAAAKAKRLAHGTLTHSNICLDGRWIDFGASTAMPGWGNIRNRSPFWSEHEALSSAFSNICFYLQKYFPFEGNDRSALPKSETLIALFRQQYQVRLIQRFVGLCGYPENVIERAWQRFEGRSAMEVLSRQLFALALSGHTRSGSLAEVPEDDSDGAEYRVGDILNILARSAENPDIDRRLDMLILDSTLRSKLVCAYQNVAQIMRFEARRDGVGAQALHRLVVLNCFKAGHTNPLLYRRRMINTVETIVRSTPEITLLRPQLESLLADVVSSAKVLYEDPKGWCSRIWSGNTGELAFDARLNCVQITVEGKAVYVPWSKKFEIETEAISSKHHDVIKEIRGHWIHHIMEDQLP